MMSTIVWVALAIIVVVAVVYVVARSGAAPNIVRIGQPGQQDDFSYTVARVIVSRHSESTDYAVVIRIDNHAVRVEYRWSNDIAYVVDGGLRYAALPVDATQAASAPIPSGGSGAYRLRFVLPRDARRPMLPYWDGILMGDVFDFAEYARASIPLETR